MAAPTPNIVAKGPPRDSIAFFPRKRTTAIIPEKTAGITASLTTEISELNINLSINFPITFSTRFVIIPTTPVTAENILGNKPRTVFMVFIKPQTILDKDPIVPVTTDITPPRTVFTPPNNKPNILPNNDLDFSPSSSSFFAVTFSSFFLSRRDKKPLSFLSLRRIFFSNS